ncbi:MAG: SDR family NAD(P)-dependent oxidoreductase [Candidatus Margulisiibacteriota bacterium]
MTSLKNKVIFVTGASRGIGFATAKLLLAQGATVFAAAHYENSLENLLSTCSKSVEDKRLFPLTFDISDPQAVRDAFSTLMTTSSGKLDGLVNCAGILTPALLQMQTSQSLEDMFKTNVYGTFYCTQYSAKLMQRNKHGSIVMISSIMGQNGKEGLSGYSASKAAIIGFALSLSKELASSGIRVNAISPGFIDTDMTQTLPDSIYQERLASIKMQRIGTPQEVANCALFLLSDLSTYVTGQVIGVDGGMIV